MNTVYAVFFEADKDETNQYPTRIRAIFQNRAHAERMCAELSQLEFNYERKHGDYYVVEQQVM